ncbi:MAG: pentapeptide repeat-containing protein [Idiomarina sp.]|nr:pentapeptide repeat-containing protein [Idiomarina sp.]
MLCGIFPAPIKPIVRISLLINHSSFYYLNCVWAELLIFVLANLSFADLSFADLSFANLSLSNLSLSKQGSTNTHHG